jgi:hypothetical protein
MSGNTTLSNSGQLDMVPVEIAVAVLRKTCDRAIDELGGAVPGAQLRALLVIDDAGGSLVHGLTELAAAQPSR